MMKFLKRAAIIVLFCIIGWGLGHFYGIANLNGYLIRWQPIEKPPVAPTEILSINNGVLVNTAEGQLYSYNNSADCKENCWVKVTSLPSTVEETLPLKKCSTPQQKITFTTFQGRCESYGPGGFHVVYYGLSADNRPYLWEDFSAEGDSIIALIAPIVGLFLGLILSVGTVVLLYIKDLGNHLRHNQKTSSS